ncbi:MAG: CoA transferase [Dehalococcoidia bacterium]|nr:CoA transferase [Dehalococcoidia bacterium]
MSDLPLDGVRVLEIGGGVAAAFAARLLAGYGAEVVRSEGPPGRLTPDEEVYLLAGKRRVAVSDSELRKIALRADIVIEDGTPGALARQGLAPEELRRAKPELVIVSITVFGQNGPYAEYEHTNLVAHAMGGIMSLTGDSSRPPLVNGGNQAYQLAGLNGFSAAVTAYYGALVHGEGDWIDISVQECAAGMLELFGPRTEYEQTDAYVRAGNHISATWGIYPCADGFAGVCCLARQVPALFRVLGDPELQDARFLDPLQRLENDDELQAKLFAWFAERTKAEVLALAHRTRSHSAPCSRRRSCWRATSSTNAATSTACELQVARSPRPPAGRSSGSVGGGATCRRPGRTATPFAPNGWG